MLSTEMHVRNPYKTHIKCDVLLAGVICKCATIYRVVNNEDISIVFIYF